MQYPKLVESKTSANEVVSVECNPGMDLLATVFSNGALTCSRQCSLQKVWHKRSMGDIISVAWRPDGRILAIASYDEKTKRNLCSLHDVENGKDVYSISKDRPITSISWFQYLPTNEEKDKEDSSKSKKVIIHPDTVQYSFSHQLAHEQSQLNMLTISTDDGKLSFYALGLFYLGYVSIHNDSNSKIIRSHLSSCLRYITCTIQTKHANNFTATLKVLRLDTFQKRSNEILRVAKMYAKITDELEYLEDTIAAITTSWVDVLAGLDNKLSSYCSRKNKKSNEDREGYTFLSADELLQLLVIGFPSDNLEKFLTDMSDKGLKKLKYAIEQTCLRVQNLIVKNAQKCCYHLHGDLNLLRGMALWKERFSAIGLDDKFIVDAMKSVGSMMLKLTELQQVIDHSLRSTKSFFRWLISIACRITGEQNNSAVPSDINKTTQQDIQLITDFILENFDYNSNQDDFLDSSFLNDDTSCEGTLRSWRPTCSNFTLEQVGQYFKNEPLSRLKYSFRKPETNFWIDFFKRRPELVETRRLPEDGSSVLLFYPHNAETSLIQEHKQTCKSVEAAFESVATNIKDVLSESDCFLNLRDFMRNAPTERIRVETDIKLMEHYTLFQTKQGPVQKQYLMSQSLNDRSFKLISIEFHTSTDAKSTLSISDSCFFETKELLLSFLIIDSTMGDTIMVQIELAKIVELANCPDKSIRDIPKIFRTSDSIDKYSSNVVLKLDIHTELSHLRRHDHGIMVKKIKSIVGKDMFSSSGRGVIVFTSNGNKRIHLCELDDDSAEASKDESDESEISMFSENSVE